MNRLLDFVKDGALGSTLTGAIAVAVVAWAINARKDRIDRRAIHDFLIKSRSETNFDFRTTEAIASHTKLPEIRVAHLCASHPLIRRNEKQLQSWSLVD